LPVATNWSVCVGVRLAFAGVTVIETKLAALTVNEALPVTVPDAAVTLTDPVLSAVNSPVVLMVASVESEVDHVMPRTGLVEPSE
jgi:hypothetical protein